MDEILSVTNVTKYYGGGVITKALDGISLKVKRGEFVAVMGASGSGKSTLLNVIATIDRIGSGQIVIDGIDISDMRESELSKFRRDKLGFVFQDYNLLDTLTVEENICLPLCLRRESSDNIKTKLGEAVSALGIADKLNKFPRELSGGERQRVACARAVITKPSLILADEPTGALDSKNSALLMQTLSYMNQTLNATILTVTHDAAVGSWANRVLFLKDGRIFTEIVRGNRSRDEFRAQITAAAALGGNDCAC